MTTKPTRTRYEIVVERHLSPATLATFPVTLTGTAVPRNRVHRLRVPADRDLVDVVRRLTDRQVQLLEIRRCPAPGTPAPRPSAPRVVRSPEPGAAELVALPPRDPAGGPAPGDRPAATVTDLAAARRAAADGHAAGTMPERSGGRRLAHRRPSVSGKEDRR